MKEKIEEILDMLFIEETKYKVNVAQSSTVSNTVPDIRSSPEYSAVNIVGKEAVVKLLSTLIQEEKKDLEEHLSKVLKQLEETTDSLMKLYIENDELKIKLKMQNDVKREAVEGFIDYVSQLELPKEGIDILSVEGLRIVNELLFRKVEEYLKESEGKK